MRIQLDVLADVEGLGKVVQLEGDFYSESQQAEQLGIKPISPRDEAYARLMTKGEGKANIGRSYGTRTSAGIEYAKYQLPILRLESRLLSPELAKKAVEANRQGVYFGTSSTKEHQESLAQAQEDLNKTPKDRSVLVLPSRNNFSISDKENWEIFEAILKDQAKPYFELNGPINLYLINPGIVDSQDGTLLTQVWFWGLVGGSVLGGGGRYLLDDNGLRGVLKSGEADAKNLHEGENRK